MLLQCRRASARTSTSAHQAAIDPSLLRCQSIVRKKNYCIVYCEKGNFRLVQGQKRRCGGVGGAFLFFLSFPHSVYLSRRVGFGLKRFYCTVLVALGQSAAEGREQRQQRRGLRSPTKSRFFVFFSSATVAGQHGYHIDVQSIYSSKPYGLAYGFRASACACLTPKGRKK